MDEVCVKDVACGRGACLSVCARVRVFVWKRVRAYVRVCACARVRVSVRYCVTQKAAADGGQLDKEERKTNSTHRGGE